MNPYILYSSFFIIAGTFALLMILILIALLVKHKSVGKLATFSALRNFIICFFCIVMLYYYESFVGIYTGEFERGTFSRVADSSFIIFMQYFWFSFIRIHLYENGCGRSKFDRMVNFILIGLFIVTDFNCIMFVNPDFYVENPMARIFAIGTEAVLCFVFCAGNFFYMIGAVKVRLQKDTRNFIIAVSILLFCNELYDEVVTMLLMSGKMEYIIESFYLAPSFPSMMCTAVCALIYLFKHNFSPVYFMERSPEVISDEEVLATLAEEHGLSKRETEVAKLIFNGDSYEDIAEQLFISKLTVKKHVHNIYEKLDIAKKMDLINLIREHKSQIQPK